MQSPIQVGIRRPVVGTQQIRPKQAAVTGSKFKIVRMPSQVTAVIGKIKYRNVAQVNGGGAGFKILAGADGDGFGADVKDRTGDIITGDGRIGGGVKFIAVAGQIIAADKKRGQSGAERARVHLTSFEIVNNIGAAPDMAA